MTEKRFRIYTDQIDHWTIVGLDLLQELTGRRLIVADIENILNGLYNENEELKKQLKSKEKAHTRCDELYWKLYDENEQLKKDCSNLIDDNTEYVAEINQMHKENGELKKILRFLRNDNATDILNVLNSQENQIWKLKKENEQLKEEIKDLNDLLARYEEKELQE